MNINQHMKRVQNTVNSLMKSAGDLLHADFDADFAELEKEFKDLNERADRVKAECDKPMGKVIKLKRRRKES